MINDFGKDESKIIDKNFQTFLFDTNIPHFMTEIRRESVEVRHVPWVLLLFILAKGSS